MVLRRIGVLSCGMIAGTLYALIGLILGGFFALFSLFGAALGAAAGEASGLFAGLFGIGAVIFFPIMYGVLGIIGGMISAALFNLVASMTGGLELEFE